MAQITPRLVIEGVAVKATLRMEPYQFYQDNATEKSPMES